MPTGEDEAKRQSQTLLAAARAGDAEARGRLLDMYRKYLLAVAGAELAGDVRSKAAPSDVVQDTLLEAHGLFARFDGQEGDEFRGWLRGILLNKVAQIHHRYHEVQKRQVGRERSLDDNGAAGLLRNVLVADSSTPSAHAVRDEEEQRLLNALARLPAEAGQVIRWRNWDRLSFAEIGARMGRKEDAARVYYVRALERLKREMDRDHSPPGPAGAP